MKLLQRFQQARQVLAVPDDAAPDAVKRAYRRAVASYPPDRDAEAFRRIRAAYELLQDPITAARQLLERPTPDIDPPQLPDLPDPPARHALAQELFRVVAARLPADVFLSTARASKRAQSNGEGPS